MNILLDGITDIIKTIQDSMLIFDNTNKTTVGFKKDQRLEHVLKYKPINFPEIAVLFSDTYGLTQVNFKYKNVFFNLYVHYEYKTKNYNYHRLNISFFKNNNSFRSFIRFDKEFKILQSLNILMEQQINDERIKTLIEIKNIYNFNNSTFVKDKINEQNLFYDYSFSSDNELNLILKIISELAMLDYDLSI